MKQLRLIALLLPLLMWACSPSPRKVVEQASRQCPITVNGVGFIRSISLNASGDTLTYHVMVTNPDMADLSALQGHEDMVKAQLRPGIMGLFEGNEPLRETLEKGGWVLQIEYATRTPGAKPLTVNFSPAQLKDSPTLQENPQERLEREVEMGRQFLPVEMAPGVAITDVLLEGNAVVYECSVSEADLGEGAIDDIRANAQAMHAEMLREMRAGTDPEVATMVKVVTDAGRDIVYRYTGVPSGKSTSLRFTLDSLR